MTRQIQFAEGEYYHVYNRGTDKRKIFYSARDYERFLALMYVCNDEKAVNLDEQGRSLQQVARLQRGKPLVALCAYCLMPNHFHFVLKEIQPGGISKFMQKISTAYTMYFNSRQKRNGVLFQGKFKASHAVDDRYLKYLISYIHLNPVKIIDPAWKEIGIRDKKATEKYLYEYEYSSFLDFSGSKRIEGIIIDRDALPKWEEFQRLHFFENTPKEWLEYRPE
jgi:putative transposase